MSSPGMGGHHSAKPKTVEWMTPPSIVAALGGRASFDLDPCAPEAPLLPTAQRHYSRNDDGLILPWDGRAFVNPPYSTAELEAWLAKAADHGCGTALIFARTETEAFCRHVWGRAHAVLFIAGRLHFHVNEDTWFARKNGPSILVKAGDPTPTNSGAPSVLVAYGAHDADVLAYCDIAGQFVPLRLRRSVLIEAFAGTWVETLNGFVPAGETVDVDALYRFFGDHPKITGNSNWKAKVRQTLRRAGYANVGPGRWERPT